LWEYEILTKQEGLFKEIRVQNAGFYHRGHRENTGLYSFYIAEMIKTLSVKLSVLRGLKSILRMYFLNKG
jgi:F0F1-type ATP synthase assembly protein I